MQRSIFLKFADPVCVLARQADQFDPERVAPVEVHRGTLGERVQVYLLVC